MKQIALTISLVLILSTTSVTLMSGQSIREDKFKQLGPELATPNEQRTASGAPGHEYWQQRADYNMKIRIDDAKQILYGEEVITYTNNSPDVLSYLWLQLDQNVFSKTSDTYAIEQMKVGESVSYNDLVDLEPWYDGGFKLDYVQDMSGKALRYTINKTMMRIDLDKPLGKGGIYSFKIKWWYNINDRMRVGGRSGYEYFEEDKNYLYTIAQYYPRMVVYSDNQGWQHKQFLGAGEFTLNFGNYTVSITVPDDHIVAATGVLQNSKEVLSAEQQRRFDQAKTSNEPIVIVTENEARENEKDKSTGEKTWTFKAENVRDFGFATSRKFIWDAQAVEIGSKKPLAMSFYPKEGNPLWGQLSTRIVAHTIRTYSKYTVDYPYPVAISVHAKWIGMEYPMICFNGGRPEADGTYDEGTRNGMISVIVHEVGHNFFPMIVNSDERQWTWMDEGLNTFVQYLAEKEYDRNYPTRRGPARNIVDYMKGDKSKMSPIMTNSESIYQFGNNAYGKPATALNILRETVMGRELFDYAFKEYCRRWAFRHPTPEDFFRTMEDASGVDLDWFWRGWFYGTDHCDMAIKEVKMFQLNTHNPEENKLADQGKKESQPADISLQRDQQEGIKPQVETDPDVRDFYTTYDPYKVTTLDKKEYDDYLAKLNADERKMLESKDYYYEVTVENVGGLIMPLIFELEYVDGTKKEVRIPAEIWKMSEPTVSKVFASDKEIKSITLDPLLETADVDLSNNNWPPRIVPTRFELFKQGQGPKGENPMQKAKKETEKK
ncbi:MAG: M1 family metallopeptidase [Flavobacteriales bacterium]